MSDLTNPNLNGRLFKNATNVEEMQMRRFRRKHEYGFVGNGFSFGSYPYMVAAMGAGTMTTTQSEESRETPQQESNEAGETASTSTGMGPSTASASGAAGGSPA